MSEETNINKEITEKVFGESWHERHSGAAFCKHCQGIWLGQDGGNLDYSSSIADAFKVVDEMERRGYQWMADGDGVTECCFEFGKPNEKGKIIWFEGKDKSRQIAICRAALLALEGEK